MANRLMPRQAVQRMSPYSPPTGGREGKLRLDFNENTVGCSPKVLAFLRDALSGEKLAVYPEYAEVRRILSSHFGVADEEMVLSNGTDEAIQVLVNTYLDAGSDVLQLAPSYAMYRFYAELAGAHVRELPYRAEDLSFPLEELIAAIRPDTRLVLISNPNNPTGAAIGLEGIEQILSAAPQCAILLDEAYYEFYGVTALPLLSRYPNLFVSRTFSKVYGMASMRMGCLFTQAHNAAYLRKAQSPYSVNTLAALAASVAVQDREYVRNFVDEALASREMVYQGLQELGIRYYPSQANFVLFHAGARARAVQQHLRAAGILVRDRGHEIAGTLRVTTGTREQTQRFLTELNAVWRQEAATA